MTAEVFRATVFGAPAVGATVFGAAVFAAAALGAVVFDVAGSRRGVFAPDCRAAGLGLSFLAITPSYRRCRVGISTRRELSGRGEG